MKTRENGMVNASTVKDVGTRCLVGSILRDCHGNDEDDTE